MSQLGNLHRYAVALYPLQALLVEDDTVNDSQMRFW